MSVTGILYRVKRKATGVGRSVYEKIRPPRHNGLPIPPPRLRQLTTLNRLSVEQHISDGRRVVDCLIECLNDDSTSLPSIDTVLDFGCGCGRILRHLRDSLPDARLVGIDVDIELITWAEENLFQVGAWYVNGYEPPSRFDDDTFDVVYAVSVFTHLTEETQKLWLEELRRILKPGGRALISVRELRERDLEEKEWDHINDAGMVIRNRTREVVRRSWTGKDAVLQEYIDVKHSEAYCRSAWSDSFEFQSFHHGILPVGQSIVVLRKPAMIKSEVA